MSIAYDGDIPGLTGVHYGGDGIGIPGWQTPTAAGADVAPSLIRSLMGDAFTPSKEYRLFTVSASGVTVLENGAGSAIAGGVVRYDCRIFEDGIEL